MADQIESAGIQQKTAAELVKQIRAVNAVLGMDVLPSNVTEGAAILDVTELKKKYPVRFQVYSEVSRFIRESVGGQMNAKGVGEHSKQISEWRNRIFEGDRPKDHYTVEEFLVRPEFSDKAWHGKGYTAGEKRRIASAMIRKRLDRSGIAGVETIIQGYKRFLYKEEDLREAAKNLPQIM